jgi:hypothetical protein
MFSVSGRSAEFRAVAIACLEIAANHGASLVILLGFVDIRKITGSLLGLFLELLPAVSGGKPRQPL